MNINDSALMAFFLDGFKISDQNVNSIDNTIQYIGMVNRFGVWYIMEQNTSTGTFRYIRGITGYSTAYSAREANVYDFFYNVFNTAS